MTRTISDLEGVCLAGRYVLDRCLSTTEGDAWYSTKLENGAQAAVRLMPENGERLALWREAVAVDHPNLVRMFDAGRAQVDSTPLIYAVCEFPDDFLAGVLEARPLSPVEARETLRAVLGGLEYLHKRGLVHGAVDPTHIMAFGEQIKLQSDTWELPASGGRRRVGPYDAPECARGAIGPASDVWSLAVTVHEVLTQQRPNLEHDSEFRYMGEPFATLLRRSLVRAPEARWTVEDVERHLHPGGPPEPAAAQPAPAKAAPAVKVEAVARPEQPPVARPATPRPAAGPAPHPTAAPTPPSDSRVPLRPIPLWWVPVAGLVAAGALGWVFLRQPDTSRTAPPAQAERAAPAADQPRVSAVPNVRKPSPMPDASRSEETRWRVIAYTYAQRSAAEKKAKELAEKYPRFRPEVFVPASENGPFLISLGGRMTRAEAIEWQQRARAIGFPKDTFARNFVK